MTIINKHISGTTIITDKIISRINAPKYGNTKTKASIVFMSISILLLLCLFGMVSD